MLVILLNVWLRPRRQGYQRRYAERSIGVGVVMVIVAVLMAFD